MTGSTGLQSAVPGDTGGVAIVDVDAATGEAHNADTAVPGLSGSVSDVRRFLSRLHADRAPRGAPGLVTPGRPLLGSAYAAAAMLMLAITVLAAVQVGLGYAPGGFIGDLLVQFHQRILGHPLGVAWLLLLAFISRRAWACLKPGAAALLEADQRAPVVYLRSFSDEQSSAQSDFQVGTFDFEATRLEEVLKPELELVGPLVAIGRPGEWSRNSVHRGSMRRTTSGVASSGGGSSGRPSLSWLPAEPPG